MSVKKFGIGQPMRRVEDHRLLTGGGRYTDDYSPDKALHAVVLRSPHAHAKFTFTDLDDSPRHERREAGDDRGRGRPSRRRAVPGLPAQLRWYAEPYRAYSGAGEGRRQACRRCGCLRGRRDPARARDAAEAIGIDYSMLPSIIDMRQAVTKGATAVWAEQPNNCALDIGMGDKAEVDGIFAKADKVVKIEIENNRLITNYMETRGVVAEYDSKLKHFKLTLGSQGVHGVRDTLAKDVLKVKPEKVQVITGDVGGGFGTKSFMYREYALAAEAARQLKRPVKWIADRSDHFTGDAQGRDNYAVAEVAMDKGGKFLAMRFDILGNLGAYCLPVRTLYPVSRRRR